MAEIRYKDFIQDNFAIVNKNEESVPFILNVVQAELLDKLCGRDIILKARQQGVSSIVLALFTVDFLLMDNSRSVCIAHEKNATVRLFDKVKYFLKAFEQKIGTKVNYSYNTRDEIINEGNGAIFYVGTAGSSSFGRSATLTNIHFSEMAFYQNPREIYLSASQAGTPKRIIIESTANGVGGFYYSMWQDAMNQKNNYRPHFFGWNKYPEYSAPDRVQIDLSEQEQVIMTDHNLSKGQMAWRRVKMSEFPNDDLFKQEYPLTPEEAFISAGNPVFSISSLMFYKNKMVRPPIARGLLVGYKPPVFEPSDHGFLKIWSKPKVDGQYVIGADTCEGVKTGDFACAQVIDRKSCEQVAIYHGRFDPDIFGRELYKLGLFYNSATLAPERNSIGIAVVLVLRELYYPNIYIRENIGTIEENLMPELGWQTNSKTKPMMIATAGGFIRQKQVNIYDEDTVRELFSYHYGADGKANAIEGGYDDRVIALMIALEMYNRVPINQDNMIAAEPYQAPQLTFQGQALSNKVNNQNEYDILDEANPYQDL